MWWRAQVDVLVSEWMGYALLFESMLDSVLVARDRSYPPLPPFLPSPLPPPVCPHSPQISLQLNLRECREAMILPKLRLLRLLWCLRCWHGRGVSFCRSLGMQVPKAGRGHAAGSCNHLHCRRRVRCGRAGLLE